MYICIYTYVYVCMCTYICIHYVLYVSICLYQYTCIFTDIYVYMDIRVYVLSMSSTRWTSRTGPPSTKLWSSRPYPSRRLQMLLLIFISEIENIFVSQCFNGLIQTCINLCIYVSIYIYRRVLWPLFKPDVRWWRQRILWVVGTTPPSP
jgi:hypothetical protein